MFEIQMAKAAKKIVEQLAGVQPGEKVLIVTDTGSDFSLAHSLASAVEAAGGEFAIIIAKPVAKAGDSPHACIGAAASSADVILTPTSRSITHSQGIRDALKAGKARLLSLSEAKPRTFVGGMFEADFLSRKPLVEALGRKMAEGRNIKIQAPGGTDLVADLGTRVPILNTALSHKPGQNMGSAIEVFIAPIEGSMNGTFVCDITCSMIGIVAQPVRIQFKDGVAVSIEGGAEAARLKELLAGVGDPGAYWNAEIAFGLNPCARVTGDIIEDEGKYGTGHVALGNNLGFGGKLTAAIHIDMVYSKPSVWIDGEQVYRDGELLIK